MMLSWSIVCCLLVTVYSQQPNEGNFYNRQLDSNFQRTDPTSYSNGGQGHAAFPQNNWRQWKPAPVNHEAQNTSPNTNGLKTPLILPSNNWQAPASGGNQGIQPQVNYNRQIVPPSQIYNGQRRQAPRFNYNGQRATNFLGSSYTGQNGAPLNNQQSPQNYNTRQEVQTLNNNRQIGASPNTYNGQIPPLSQNFNTRKSFQTLNYNGQRQTPINAGQTAPSPQNFATRQNVPPPNNNEQREITSTVYHVQSAASPQSYNIRQGVQPINYNGQNGTQSTAYNVQKVSLQTNNNEPNLPPPLSNNDRTGSSFNYNNQKLLVTQSNNGPKNALPPYHNAQSSLVPLSSNYNTKESQLFRDNGQREPLSSTNHNQRFHIPSSTSSQTSLPSSQLGKSSVISNPQEKSLDSQFLRSSSTSSQTFLPSSQTRQSSIVSSTQGKSLDSQFLRSTSTNSQTFFPSSQTGQSSIISSSKGKSLDSQFLRSSSSNRGIKNSPIFSITTTTPLPRENYEKITDSSLLSSKVPLEFHKELEREI